MYNISNPHYQWNQMTSQLIRNSFQPVKIHYSKEVFFYPFNYLNEN